MDLAQVQSVGEIAAAAQCSPRTVERWLTATHPTVADANRTFARQLPGTGGWLIHAQHPHVVSFVAAPHRKGRPPSPLAITKEASQ